MLRRATAKVDHAIANHQMKIRWCHINPPRPDLLAIAWVFGRQPPGSLQNQGQAALATWRQREHHKECNRNLREQIRKEGGQRLHSTSRRSYHDNISPPMPLRLHLI